MEDSTRLGVNRTGVQMSPIHGKAMLAALHDVPTAAQRITASEPAHGGASPLAALRAQYLSEAEAVGSVPAPGTLKGVAKSGLQMLTGHRPQLLVDRLAERLAFERTGTRLYEALILKHEAGGEQPAGDVLGTLRRFRDEEARHFEWVAEAIESLGGDPTAQTPGADLAGMQGFGLMQALTDPRTTFAQGLHTILIAELADNAAWDVLTEVAEEFGQDQLVERFRLAIEEEQAHLQQVQRWYREMALGTSRVVGGTA